MFDEFGLALRKSITRNILEYRGKEIFCFSSTILGDFEAF
jgi:hypothetical protein